MSTNRILVTGYGGMAVAAIEDLQKDYPQYEFIMVSHSTADLRDKDQVDGLFNEIKPTHVIHAAAKVGGVQRNLNEPYDLFYDNILINTNVINAAKNWDVDKLIAFCSVCIFPDGQGELIESNLHGGPCHDANFAYGYAKRMVDVQIKALKRQWPGKANGFMWVSPSNIFYYRNDYFNLENAHIIPALVHKLYLAKQNNTDFVIWGDGSARREFLWMGDAASCILQLLDMPKVPDGLLLCGPQEHTIKEIVMMLVEVADFDKSRIIFDTTKPNGQHARPSSKTLFNQYFPNFQYTDIKTGLDKLWHHFQNAYPNIRL